MTTTQLPDLPGITPDPDEQRSHSANDVTHRRPKPATRAQLIALFIVTLILTIPCTFLFSWIYTTIKPSTIAELFGGTSKPRQPTPTELAISELKSNQQLISQAIDEIRDDHKRLSDYVNTNSLDLDKNSKRVEAVASLVSSLENRIEKNERQSVAQAAAVKKQATQRAANAKPKSPPVIPLILISIRNQAGTPLVALRDGLDNSDLLMPGDTWRGWTLISADPTTKTATFRVADTTRELRL